MKNLYRLAFFTGSRSEFGLLWPVIRGLAHQPNFDCYIFAGGTHLSNQWGYTITEVQKLAEENNIPVSLVGSVPRYEREDGALFWASSLISDLTFSLREWGPGAIFILGDRVEAFSAAFVSFLQERVIVHMGGGNITSGGTWDDSLRHSITKMAHFHFVTCKKNAENLLALREEPWRVHITGSPAVERVLAGEIADFEELSSIVSTQGQLKRQFLLFSFHPDSSDRSSVRQRIVVCLEALKQTKQQVLITGPNGDPGSEQILKVIHDYVEQSSSFFFSPHLGARLYLSALQFCSAVVGNSSSGLTETPIFRKPAIDIGNRQLGRQASCNVIHVSYDVGEILSAIQYVQTNDKFLQLLQSMENPFDYGRPSENIGRLLPRLLEHEDLLVKKWPDSVSSMVEKEHWSFKTDKGMSDA